MLTTVICIVLMLVSFVSGIWFTYTRMLKETIKSRETYEKFHSMYQMLERLIYCKQAGYSIGRYLLQSGIAKIAIYGCGDVGRILYNELLDEDIEVKYGIDKNTKIDFPIEIRSLSESLDEVDAVIVTSIAYFSDIEEELSKVLNCRILALDDVIYEISY